MESQRVRHDWATRATCLNVGGKRLTRQTETRSWRNKHAAFRSLTFLLRSLRCQCRKFRQEGNMVIFMKGHTDGGCLGWSSEEDEGRLSGSDWGGVLILSWPIEIFLEVRLHGIHRKTYSSLHSAGHIVRAGWLDEWMNKWVGGLWFHHTASLTCFIISLPSAIYLCKRTMQNKARLELADYEAVSMIIFQVRCRRRV